MLRLKTSRNKTKNWTWTWEVIHYVVPWQVILLLLIVCPTVFEGIAKLGKTLAE